MNDESQYLDEVQALGYASIDEYEQCSIKAIKQSLYAAICKRCVPEIKRTGLVDPAKMPKFADFEAMNETIEVYGRKYLVMAKFSGADYMDAANAYMEATPEAGLIAEVDGVAYLSWVNDKGFPARRVKPLSAG